MISKHGSCDRKVIIVGSDSDAKQLYAALRRCNRFGSVTLVEPELNALKRITSILYIDIIINATQDEKICRFLKMLHIAGTDIISAQSAKILFLSGTDICKNGTLPAQSAAIRSRLQEMRKFVHLTDIQDELLKVILNLALNSLSADSGSIMLMDSTTGSLTIGMASGLDSCIVNSVRQRIGSGISGQVAQSRRPMLIIGKVAREHSNIDKVRSDLSSAICCPMIIKNDVVGVINVNSKSPERIFSGEDIEELRSLSAFTAEIIKASRDYSFAVRESFEKTVLDGIGAILKLDLPLQERLNLSMMKIVGSLHAKLCNVYLFDSVSKRFLVNASSSFAINIYQNEAVRLNDFFSGRALRSDEPFVFNVNMGTSKYKKWFIGHPIIHEGTKRGLLMLHLITDRENVNKEAAILGKVSAILRDSLARTISLQSTKMQSIQFSALSEITFNLDSVHNVRQLAKMIVTNACLILEAQSCVLSLYNSIMECFEVFESFSIRGPENAKEILEIDKIIANRSIGEKDGLLIKDLLLDDSIPVNYSVRSAISMSLFQDGNCMGAISVYDKNSFGIQRQSGFSENDREVFVRFCLQATKAMNRFFVIKPSIDKQVVNQK